MMFLSRRKAALRAEILAKQATVSKKQAALRETIVAEEQQKIGVEKGTATELKSQAEPVKKSLGRTAPWDTITAKLPWLHQWLTAGASQTRWGSVRCLCPRCSTRTR